MKTSINVFVGASALALLLSTKAMAIPIWDTEKFNGAANSSKADAIAAPGAGVGFTSASWATGSQQGGGGAASAGGAASTPPGLSALNSITAGRAIAPGQALTARGQGQSNSLGTKVADFIASLDIGNRGGQGNPRAAGSNGRVGSGDSLLPQLDQSINVEAVVDLTAHTVPDTGLTILLVGGGLGLLGLTRLRRRSV